MQGTHTAHPSTVKFNRSSMTLYRIANVTLHTSILDLQILAGLPRLMGKPVKSETSLNVGLMGRFRRSHKSRISCLETLKRNALLQSWTRLSKLPLPTHQSTRRKLRTFTTGLRSRWSTARKMVFISRHIDIMGMGNSHVKYCPCRSICVDEWYEQFRTSHQNGRQREQVWVVS